MKRFFPLLAMAVALTGAASAAQAVLVSDFEGLTPLAGWTVSGGTAVSTAQTFAGTQSLYVPSTGRAIINIPGMSGGGSLTVEIYDQGNYTDIGTRSGAGTTSDPYVYSGVSYDNGFRVGVTPSITGSTAGMAAMLVDQRTSVNGANYSYSQGDGTPFGGFFSPWYNGVLNAGGGGPGTVRQVVNLSSTPNNGSLGVGQWTQWQFNFDGAGNVSYFPLIGGVTPNWHYQATAANTGGAANSFFVYGGDTNLNGGVFIDNVTFTPTDVPEPASLALLGLGAGTLLLARRRRA